MRYKNRGFFLKWIFGAAAGAEMPVQAQIACGKKPLHFNRRRILRSRKKHPAMNRLTVRR